MPDLIMPGDKLYDVVTGIHVTLIELRPDGFIAEQVVEPNKTKSTLSHFHQTWTETFEITSGTGRYMLAGQEYDAAPGHRFVVQPGQAHIHPWNTGQEALHFRQTDIFAPADPTAAVETFLGFSTMFGLAKEGKANAEGVPKNPLQLMMILNLFRQHGGYLSGLPAPVQDVIMAGGAALGQVLGYRPWYERYLPKNHR